jgi:hypothetical protein
VATSHKQVLDPRNADFAKHLSHCLDLIRGGAQPDPATVDRASRLVER